MQACVNKCIAPRCCCDVKLGSRFVSTLLQTNTANIKSRPAKKNKKLPLKSLERPCSVQLIESGIIVAPRSYILLFWDCPLIRIGIKRETLFRCLKRRKCFIFQSSCSQTRGGAALPAPIWFYSTRWLNNWFINDFPHVERASRDRGEKRKQQQQKKSRTNKSRPCLKALWCVINRCSSPSATDCQLPPSSEDQRDSWRTPPTSKARNATDTYEPGAHVRFMWLRACACRPRTEAL